MELKIVSGGNSEITQTRTSDSKHKIGTPLCVNLILKSHIMECLDLFHFSASFLCHISWSRARFQFLSQNCMILVLMSDQHSTMKKQSSWKSVILRKIQRHSVWLHGTRTCFPNNLYKAHPSTGAKTSIRASTVTQWSGTGGSGRGLGWVCLLNQEVNTWDLFLNKPFLTNKHDTLIRMCLTLSPNTYKKHTAPFNTN